MNKSRGIKNIIFGFAAQIITISLGIVIPRLILVNLGSEANGLLSSIGNILTYMSLLEAGVGTATIQALYAPVGKNDYDSINHIMAATDYFYRKTGKIYLIAVIGLSAGYTAIVNTELPKTTVFAVIILSGLSGVISYFFQGKYKLLLSAEGKDYITTNITTIATVGISITKAMLLIAGFDVVAVQVTYFVFNLLQTVFFSVYIYKNYKWLDLKVKPNLEAISQKKAVLVHQISGLIFSNTDVIILTIFTSLHTVSVYSMYAMIFGMVKSIAVTLSGSFVYALGQSYQNRDRFLRIFDVYEVYNVAITFALFCIARILMIPFLELYTVGITDVNYIDPYIPWLFVIYYLLHNGRVSSNTIINIAQEFENTKWRSVLESIINLTASIILTIKFGIYGVLLGTIIALLYRTNDIIIYAARIIKRTPFITYRRWVLNFFIFMSVNFVASKVQFNTDSYFKLFEYGILLSVSIIPLFIIINSIAEPKTARNAWAIIRNMLMARKK